ncbi:MAG: hypothetical protein ACN6OT_19785 [Comamonas sp.]
MQLLGMHGTSATRAAAILESRVFRIAEPVGDKPFGYGYGGRGAYFWAYEQDEDYGWQLARSWWAFAHRKKDLYAGDADCSCAVLGVEISPPPEGKLLDATEQLFREALFQAMQNKKSNKQDLPEVTAVLIEEMEAANGDVFDVVKLHIATPPVVSDEYKTYAQIVSRASDAYLVKDTGLNLIGNIRIINR